MRGMSQSKYVKINIDHESMSQSKYAKINIDHE